MAAERVRIPSDTITEEEYPISSEDPIRPTPESDRKENEWYVIPVRPKVRPRESITKRSMSSRSTNKNAAALLRATRKAKRTAKKAATAVIKNRVIQNKYRWTRGTPDVLDDHYKEQFEQGIVQFFRPGYETYWNDRQPAEYEKILSTIRALFKKYKLIVSGGFVLKNTGLSSEDLSKPSVDIDIYMSHETPNTHPDFYDTMAKLFHCDIVETPKGAQYDINKFIASGGGGKHSFFKKNGIYSVFKHSRHVDGVYAEMDLVRPVRGVRNISIVKNFDLTVCMNWYDGSHVYAMDVEGIMKTGVSYLSSDYVPLLLGIKNSKGAEHEPNKVTRDRVLKYILRGYRIQYMDPRTGEMVEILVRDLLNSVNRLPQNKQQKVRNQYHLSPSDSHNL
jgi:hypothetical protein